MADYNELSETLNKHGISTTRERDNNNPVKALGIAVIVQAIEDVNKHAPKNKKAKSYQTTYKEWQQNFSTARSFLLTDNPDLDFWCATAEISPEYIREKVKLMMDSGT